MDRMNDGSTFLAAIVFAVAAFFLLRLVERMFRRSVPQDMQRWRDALERAAIAVIHADLAAAETKAHLFELIGTIPKDFDPTAFLTLQLAAGVHRAVLAEAEQRGLVRAGTFQNVYGATVESPPVEAPGVVDVKPAEPPVEFVDGKLVPREPS